MKLLGIILYFGLLNAVATNACTVKSDDGHLVTVKENIAYSENGAVLHTMNFANSDGKLDQTTLEVPFLDDESSSPTRYRDVSAVIKPEEHLLFQPHKKGLRWVINGNVIVAEENQNLRIGVSENCTSAEALLGAYSLVTNQYSN